MSQLSDLSPARKQLPIRLKGHLTPLQYITNGRIYGIYNKRALPDYGVFDEERYFSPGKGQAPIFEINGVNVGVTICEDLWLPNGVIDELATNGAQIVLNLNASPYEQGKYKHG